MTRFITAIRALIDRAFTPIDRQARVCWPEDGDR